MKPEIIDYNKFMLRVDRARHSGAVSCYKCCREHMKRAKGFMLVLVQMANWNLPLERKFFSINIGMISYNRIWKIKEIVIYTFVTN
jgi:hypothetical protein